MMRTQRSYTYRDDEKLIQENYLLRMKLSEMEDDKVTFGALYAELLQDFRAVVEENKNYKILVKQLQK